MIVQFILMTGLCSIVMVPFLQFCHCTRTWMTRAFSHASTTTTTSRPNTIISLDLIFFHNH